MVIVFSEPCRESLHGHTAPTAFTRISLGQSLWSCLSHERSETVHRSKKFVGFPSKYTVFSFVRPKCRPCRSCTRRMPLPHGQNTNHRGRGARRSVSSSEGEGRRRHNSNTLNSLGRSKVGTVDGLFPLFALFSLFLLFAVGTRFPAGATAVAAVVGAVCRRLRSELSLTDDEPSNRMPWWEEGWRPDTVRRHDR